MALSSQALQDSEAGRVFGIPQDADEVQKLVDSMLSGLCFAHAPLCSR
jgi:hypothetical protein